MKTYRERIKSLPAWKSGFPVSRAEALRVADAADALQAECEALRADAERYRWIKSAKGLRLESETSEWFRTDGTRFISTHCFVANGTQHASHETLDQTIDAALATTPPTDAREG